MGAMWPTAIFYWCICHIIKSPREPGCGNATKGCALQMQPTTGAQLTGQTHKVRELSDPSQAFPSAQALLEAAGAFKGLHTPAAHPVFHCASRIPAAAAFAGASQVPPPSPPEPSGKVWTCWQDN